MNNVNKTLYIPLYGKSYVSRRGILLRDPDAEAIWEAEGFPLRGKAKSKWLAYYMSMTPENLICQLPKGEQGLFRKLYAGKFARRLYRLYEYEGGNRP